MSSQGNQVAFPCPWGTVTSQPTRTINLLEPWTPFPTAPFEYGTISGTPTSIPGTSFKAPHGTLPYGKPYVIPPGTLPNFASPPTLAPAVIGVNIAFITLSCIAVSLRIWGRRSAGQRLWSDDWLILIAWIMAFAVSFSASWSTRAGTGRHVWDIPPDWITADQYPQAIWLMTIFFVIACTFIKLSLLIFYHRFSASNLFRLTIYATILFVIGSGFSLCMAMFFICLPIEANWIYSLRYDPGTQCLNMFALFTSGSVINAVSALFVWLLPLPIIVKSKMSKTRKMHVYSVFSLGGLVVIASFVRVYLVVAAERHTVDYGWKVAHVMIASAIEVNIGIICACLPAIKQLLARYFPMYFAPNTKSFQVPPSNEAWTQMWRKFIPSISTQGSKYTFENHEPPKYEGSNPIVDAYAKREFYAESESDAASTRKLYGQYAKETGGMGIDSTGGNGNGSGGGGGGAGGGGGGWFSGNTWNSSRRHESTIRESNISRSGTLKKIKSRDPQPTDIRDSGGQLVSSFAPTNDELRPTPSPIEPAHLDIDKWPEGKL
ncbi:hypothetical protein BJ508DRAFT_330460 [Ascobolus immersus RN42]|uniref:Rhodopsin domain-containing protein n=1 Tax=Ascobolus immersus RN42 TaxID=1160509 RepID=A0A3N4HTG6_ASCIM|nr:hypothetical protein BJ508DRAFT_330460 [Ascobolus immersus RN42]